MNMEKKEARVSTMFCWFVVGEKTMQQSSSTVLVRCTGTDGDGCRFWDGLVRAGGEEAEA